MKKYLLFTLIVVSLNGFSQITVPQTTKSFYGIVEATWCGLCGQYGIPATADIISQTSPEAVYVSLHKSATSLLYSQTAENLATAFGTSGQPIFTLNGNNLGPHSATIVDEVVSGIHTFYSASTATVNAGFEYGIVGDSLYVHTKTTFFQELSGEYYVGVYVFEDSIWEWQVNYDPGIADMDIWHNHVLRASLNGHFGQEVASGTITAGSSFNRNVKMALESFWNPAQLHVFTIVWKKNGSVFEFVNANDQGTIITGQVGIPENNEVAFNVYPNPTSRLIAISGLQITPETSITLFDLQGNLVLQVNGSAEIDLYGLANGQYILQVNQGTCCYRQRVFKNQ